MNDMMSRPACLSDMGTRPEREDDRAELDQSGIMVSDV